LLIAFAIFVFVFAIYAYAVQAREQPAGARWLWVAAVVAGGVALATDGSDVSTGVKIGLYALAAGLLVFFTRARNRAAASSPDA
jgi:hypothetical protein